MDKETWTEVPESGWWQGWVNRIHRNLLSDNAWKLIVGGLYTTSLFSFLERYWRSCWLHC